MNFFKNNTIYKGKVFFKFEKNPFYDQHFDLNNEIYISVLDDILINFFNKFYLSKRVKTDGYSYDEEKINLIKRQGIKIKTKIELFDEQFKTLRTDTINDYITNVEIDNPNNSKVYLSYFTTNKNDVKIGDLFFAWDLVQEDIIDIDVASKNDNFCSIGFLRKRNKWLGIYRNESETFDINENTSYEDAKKLAINFVENLKNNK